MQPAQSLVETATTVIVRETVLGAFAVLALGLAVWAIWELKRTQENRVGDQKLLSEQLAGFGDRSREVYEQQRQVQAALALSVDRLADATADNTDAVNNLREAVSAQSAVIDSTIRNALLAAAKRQPMSQPTMTAVKPPPWPRPGGTK